MNDIQIELNSTSTTESNSQATIAEVPLRSKVLLYLVENSIGTLEQILLVALVYIFVCLSIHRFLYRRFYGFDIPFVHTERFPTAKRVLIVTAHPDDECMFFGPTILSLSRRPNCKIYLLCLSTGNYERKGQERKQELWNSTALLNIESENVQLINATHLPDDPNVNWKVDTVAKLILNSIESLDIEVLITFDREGVSQHSNHCAIYYAAASLCVAGLMPKNCSIFTLDTINIVRKYLSIFDLVISLTLSTNWFILNWNDVHIVRNAMREHKSQLVWFRKLYIIFSRYMVINSLREMNLSDIELEMQINDS